MSLFPSELIRRLERSQVVAVFSVDRADQATPIVRSLLAGGIDAIELTLRTPVAMEAVKRVCLEVPEMLLGVGTILTVEAVAEVKAAGAAFGFSPGLNPRVVRAAHEIGLPFAPGICTPSELEAAIELGCRLVKFFPAEASGGLTYLRSMAAPYKHLGIQYLPLGGLSTDNLLDYLNEANIPAVGGSWIVKKDLVDNENWSGLTDRAAAVRRILEGQPQ